MNIAANAQFQLTPRSSIFSADSTRRWSSPPGTSPASTAGPPSGRPVPSDVSYCQHVDFAIASSTWTRIRSQLLDNNQCLVLQAFAITDKAFQTALLGAKFPDSFVSVGTSRFSSDAWRDLKEYFEALDLWNFLCALVCSNFRVILDNGESISIGGSEVARMLQAVPTFQFVGHSEFTTGIAQWHAQHVLETPTLLYASLSSVVLRERSVRPVIMLKINSEAKAYLRSTFIRNDGLFVTYIAALHSWRFKEADVWAKLFELNQSLAEKKPPDTTIRDWRLQLDRRRTERQTLAKADIDGYNEHLWIMRCLETLSEEPWYRRFRKNMAQDERRGHHILNIEELWEKVEFEETWREDDPPRRGVNAVSDESANKRTHYEDERLNVGRFSRDYEVSVVGRGRTKGLGRGRGEEPDHRRSASGRGRGDTIDRSRPGARKWASIGYPHEHPHAKPNDSSWVCRVCNKNPCSGFCEICLMTCGHRATYSNPSACPYINGERTVRSWDFSRPCMKCRVPQADHQPWNCPEKRHVRIVNRQHPP